MVSRNTNEYEKFEENSSGNVAVRIKLVDPAGYTASTKSLGDKEAEKFTTDGGGDTAIRVISVSE